MQPDRSKIFALLTAMLLAGCASVGNESLADSTSESVSRQLIKGRTSQAEVRRIFGDPIKTSFASNGNELWEYEFSRMRSKVTNFIRYVNLVHSGAWCSKHKSQRFARKFTTRSLTQHLGWSCDHSTTSRDGLGCQAFIPMNFRTGSMLSKSRRESDLLTFMSPALQRPIPLGTDFGTRRVMDRPNRMGCACSNWSSTETRSRTRRRSRLSIWPRLRAVQGRSRSPVGS